MTEKLREQVSALADDELPESEHELLARRFTAERHLCLCWERYHLIGEAMRKSLPPVDTRGFADRIMLALGQEQFPQKPRGLGSHLGRAAAGIMVAACVAVVALIGVRYEGAASSMGSTTTEIVPPASNILTTPVAYGMVNNATWNGNTPNVQAELNNYIISHNEISAALGQQNVLPYFYITTYNTLKPPRNPTRNGQQTLRPNKP